jgi:hypothetical protein
MRGTLDMGSNKLTGLTTPTTTTDAATKAYVDSTVSTGTAGGASVVYVDQQDALRVLKSGDTMGGRLGQSNKGFHSAHRDNITTRIDSGFYQTNVAKKSTGWPADTNGWYHLLTSTHYNDANYYSMQFASQFDSSNELYYRSTIDNGNGAWNKIFHSGNTNTLSLIGYHPVNKAGDVMSGFLSLHSNPTENAHAANKAYVDTAVNGSNASASSANTNANTRVLKSGDTMSGNLTINNGSPTLYLQDSDHRSSMIHCNSNIFYILRGDGNNSANWSALPGQGWPLELNLENNIAYFGGDVYSKNKILATQEAVNTKFNISGGTLTGFLNLHSNPTENAHAANKAYVDTQVATKTTAAYVDQEAGKRVLKTGDTMSGNLTINNDQPTIFLKDSNNRSSMIHCNSNLFYILRGDGNNSATWDSGPNSRHPMVLNLENGNVVFSGDVTAYSDSRLKKNINPIENALDKTLKLEGVSYERLESDDKHIGLIAQKVKEVLPEVVNEDKDGYFTVSYGNIVGLLVEAIKELNAKVEKLENKNI